MEYKILIIDDSDLVSGILAENLGQKGFKTVRAKDGLEGVLLTYSEAPSLVIMDVDMPVIPGYQASRLLKNCRFIDKIPIIMHTGLNEDKDKYWALTSGADAFVTKNADNTDELVDKIAYLCEKMVPDKRAILAESKNISRDKIIEMMGHLYDAHLFRSTVFNLLADLGKTLGSTSVTVFGIFDIVAKISEYTVSAVYLNHDNQALGYIFNKDETADSDDFRSLCENDFSQHFPKRDMAKIQYVQRNPDSYQKNSPSLKRVSSYLAYPLYGKGKTIIGTFHIGHKSNNFFSQAKQNNLAFFAESCGIQLENTLLFASITRMQDRIRNVFSKFVPSEIINDLLISEEKAEKMLSEKRDVAVLMTDIREFTTMTEMNEAETVVAFLNSYFDMMGNIIKRYGGTIDKFIGDAILAVFGAPKSYEDNVQRAYNSAVQMLLDMRNFSFPELKTPSGKVSIGIGIHKGPTIVGNIGSADKFNYTVIGDTVNVASRLESLTKFYKRPLIISQQINEKVTSNLYRRPLDIVCVKGKSQPTEIFAVEIGKSMQDPVFRENYEKALKLYRLGTFQTALEYFQKCQTMIPGDPVSQLYLSRCSKLLESPPSDFSPVIELDFK